MHDLLVASCFILMLLVPCIIANRNLIASDAA